MSGSPTSLSVLRLALAVAGALVVASVIALAETPRGAPEQFGPPKPDARPQARPDARPDARKGDADKSDPKADAAGKTAAVRKPVLPKTPAQKARMLGDLYERLTAAESAQSAETVSAMIEQMWLYSGSDTANLVMERALIALQGKQPELSLKLLDGVIALNPGYTEAWNRRAYVHFAQKDYARALIDLRQVLILDPRHFKAINGLATIMREFGHKGQALKAYRRLLEVHPYWSDAQSAVKELEREVEGENI